MKPQLTYFLSSVSSQHPPTAENVNIGNIYMYREYIYKSYFLSSLLPYTRHARPRVRKAPLTPFVLGPLGKKEKREVSHLRRAATIRRALGREEL